MQKVGMPGQPVQPGQPKPAGMRTKAIAHTSFEAIERDCASWFSEKPIRQIIVIQTYPVQVMGSTSKSGVNWFTVIHYMLYL